MKGFYIVEGAGEGGVSLLIRKTFIVWLYRLVIFGEISRYVVDGQDRIVVYNHRTRLQAVLDRKHKIHAMYDYDSKEWSHAKYNEAWFGGLHGGKPTTKQALLNDPYHFWVKGYKAHFVLEKPFSRRKYYAYYRPI